MKLTKQERAYIKEVHKVVSDAQRRQKNAPKFPNGGIESDAEETIIPKNHSKRLAQILAMRGFNPR